MSYEDKQDRQYEEAGENTNRESNRTLELLKSKMDLLRKNIWNELTEEPKLRDRGYRVPVEPMIPAAYQVDPGETFKELPTYEYGDIFPRQVQGRMEDIPVELKRRANVRVEDFVPNSKTGQCDCTACQMARKVEEEVIRKTEAHDKDFQRLVDKSRIMSESIIVKMLRERDQEEFRKIGFDPGAEAKKGKDNITEEILENMFGAKNILAQPEDNPYHFPEDKFGVYGVVDLPDAKELQSVQGRIDLDQFKALRSGAPDSKELQIRPIGTIDGYKIIVDKTKFRVVFENENESEVTVKLVRKVNEEPKKVRSLKDDLDF